MVGVVTAFVLLFDYAVEQSRFLCMVVVPAGFCFTVLPNTLNECLGKTVKQKQDGITTMLKNRPYLTA